jgi:hypothetical protein
MGTMRSADIRTDMVPPETGSGESQMKCALRPLTISERALRAPLEVFIGYHLICERCEDSFRCFREHERFCGACREKVKC